MRKAVLILCAALAGCAGRFGVVTKTEGIAGPTESRSGTVCMLAGSLPDGVSFREIGTIKAGKRSYGGTDEIMRAMADEARHIGADVVTHMVADQRFKGPIPWRAVAPTGAGKAVKVSVEFDCEKAGGQAM